MPPLRVVIPVLAMLPTALPASWPAFAPAGGPGAPVNPTGYVLTGHRVIENAQAVMPQRPDGR